ncbi:MAG: type III toxin-antitoxin system ToxN/AbiQ family toxin [Lachnospiraceae bacterium]|nr:type III toxin-antitoxin system ToxN/AbiQ family toxin [Lachnospiraceae bacterium]MBQ6024156.1 type III toxin-antitoxin system ToxN/AbiQ family toxin [Lachnospiraceae bacterium]MBR3484015.1 type III toxin-antitoxin system ToxN/AbiQ family toxin [Lachnospiraceae bacterium]MBR3580026.1 type III toxin-antitoxin system ToxN/AbiQ family toxin [Lachnospiraceae bacterium]MBR4541140.1 type III toxin-antitoxin system ToxN/AbiQ family toxin [Lachnospiraceae bacterium]
MKTVLSFYKVDMKYIRNLHNIDDKVLSVSPQTGKHNRIFVGIVVVCNNYKYCIPLSSPKKKHNKMKSALDFEKIEVEGKLLGVLNYNLMIPIQDRQLQIVDLVSHKRDREPVKRYKELCRKELLWCNNHSETICNKANVIYKQCTGNGNYKGKSRCLDFIRLERECDRYNKGCLS